jgi:antitoxin component YwqK of YwqJK toxin-antitoxin module
MKKDIPSLKKFYKDDNKIASYYFNEKGIISSICLHKNEKEKRFLYDDGILKYEYNTINGKNNGKKYRYLKSGKKLLIGIYKDDIVQGKLLNYHKDGKVKLEYFYKDGKRNGKHVEYYSNGKKKIENFFKDDKYTKTWKTWDKNNKLTLSVKFKKDLLYSSNNKPFTGKLIVDSYFKTYYFYKNGMKSSQSIYQDDKLVSNTFFDENGKIKKEDK